MSNKECSCCESPVLIFSCSCRSDVGVIAEKSAMKLNDAKIGKMCNLNNIDSHTSGILKAKESATKILAIDGCPVDCSKKTLEHAGFAGIDHFRITDMGMQKGKSPATEDRIDAVFKKGKNILEK